MEDDPDGIYKISLSELENRRKGADNFYNNDG
jgi:hypothetical protein